MEPISALGLDHIGQWVIHTLSVKAEILLSLGLAAVLCLIRKFGLHSGTTFMGFAKVLFATMMFFTSLLVLAVFLLTDPPAYEQISVELRGIVGALASVAMCTFSYSEIKHFLMENMQRKRSKEIPGVSPSHPPTDMLLENQQYETAKR